MKPHALLFRSDANVFIGTGHVMRCLAIAQAWQDVGGEALFAAGEMPEGLRSRLRAHGLPFAPIEATPGSLEDAVATITQAHEINADWVVVDGDRFRNDFLEHLYYAGLHVLLIDDGADRAASFANLIVNPNFGANEKFYRAQGLKAPVLAGPSYILLRREFHESGEKHASDKGNRVLITLGGSDPDDLTPRIAAALDSPGLKLTVVAGAAYSNAQALQGIRGRQLKVMVDAQNMAELMKESDLAVIAAGGTLGELLAVGCVALSYARNTLQMRAVQALAREGVVLNMGDAALFDVAALALAVERLTRSKSAREQMAARGRKLVDGRGAARVVEAIQHWEGRR
jgi:UDP-2,4-diacetamido-2,4,6-trideoxy-beta-L-altropyranose hydrolase